MLRVDAARPQTLTRVGQSIVPDESQARSAAMIPYLILIGASVAAPTQDRPGASGNFTDPLPRRICPAAPEPRCCFGRAVREPLAAGVA